MYDRVEDDVLVSWMNMHAIIIEMRGVNAEIENGERKSDRQCLQLSAIVSDVR